MFKFTLSVELTAAQVVKMLQLLVAIIVLLA